MTQQQYQRIDPFVLMAAVENDLQLFRNLSATFLDIAPPALLRLLQAMDAGNCERITYESHSLRGTVALVGAHEMVTLLRNIETMSRQAAIDQIKTLQDELRTAFDEIEAEVRDSALHFVPGMDRRHALPADVSSPSGKSPA